MSLLLTSCSLHFLCSCFFFHPVHGSTPENNRFGYIYTVNNDSEITPPSDQLELMDVHMLDHQLVNFMQQVLENADQSFYQNNTETANNFFSRPAYPQCAIDSLGYPGDNNNN
jgi:hypothetical protein